MTETHEPYQLVTSGPQDPEYLPPAAPAISLHENLEQAFAALTRVVTVAEHQQFSRETITAARAALDTLRAQLMADRVALYTFTDRSQQVVTRIAAERDLWQRRAEAQLDITRAAVAIVEIPYEIYDSRGSLYCISQREYNYLKRTVEAYKQLSAQADTANRGDRMTES